MNRNGHETETPADDRNGKGNWTGKVHVVISTNENRVLFGSANLVAPVSILQQEIQRGSLSPFVFRTVFS